MKTLLMIALLHGLPELLPGQAVPARDSLRGVPRFSVSGGPVTVSGAVRPWAEWADRGRKAAVLGVEAGTLEVWTGPWRLVRDVRLAFKVPDYDEAIEGRALARNVVTRAEGVTITYSHASFTVRQHVFVPVREAGVVMLLEVETTRPLEVLLRLQADTDRAGAGGAGAGVITWQQDHHRFLLMEGGVRPYHGLIGSPLARTGRTQAAQGRSIPAELVLAFAPSNPSTDLVPLIMAGGVEPRDSVERVYQRLLGNPAQYWRDKVAHYRRLRQELLSMELPDVRMNQAFDWAKVNLDQRFTCDPDSECRMVSGSGQGADAAMHSAALSAIGHFEPLRAALGSPVPADQSTWLGGPAQPFWILACYAYWQASGDDAFLRREWSALSRAFRWSAATDADGDGLIDNPKAGAGAEVAGLVENLWTDIHLAGVWVAALEAIQVMAAALSDEALRASAAVQHAKAQQSLESRFWLERAGIYGSTLQGSDSTRFNDALTAWPATAMSFGLLDAQRSDRMLRDIGSSALTTDWGVRLRSRYHRLYDPLHGQNGAVRAMATEFAALAHYRYHRSWAGHDLVRDAARATFDFGRGRAPEQLSGAYYNLVDGFTPAQFFATSTLVNPLVRGLLGIEVDAPNRSVAIEPHLPAEWNGVSVNDIWVGRERVHVTIRRTRGKYGVALRRTGTGAPVFVRLSPALPLGSVVDRILIGDSDAPLQIEETVHDVHPVIELQLAAAAEIEIDYSGGLEVLAPAERLEIGDGSSAIKILDFREDQREFIVLVEGAPGSTHTLAFRPESRVRSVAGAEIVEQNEQRLTLRVRFGATITPFARREIRIRM